MIYFPKQSVGVVVRNMVINEVRPGFDSRVGVAKGYTADKDPALRYCFGVIPRV